MAKSFKQVAPRLQPAAKPASERDFLDFLEEEHGVTAVAQPEATPETISGNTSNTGNKRATGNTSNTDNTSNTIPAKVRKAQPAAAAQQPQLEQPAQPAADELQEVDVRQTFIISEQYLEKLKNFVHARRATGEYNYTQKQALHEALDKLFAGVEVAARPEHIRRQEEQRKQKIRRGKEQ